MSFVAAVVEGGRRMPNKIVSRKPCHFVRAGVPLSLGLSVWCGVNPKKANGHTVSGDPDVVTCRKCIEFMRGALSQANALERWSRPVPTDAVGAWRRSGDCGMSSVTIWATLSGRGFSHDDRPGRPHDPSDFGRCHRLLERFPEWRTRLGEVADRHPEWRPFVDAWEELTALWLEESPSGTAPKLYARMKELAP